MKFKVYVDAQCRKLLQLHRGSFCDCVGFLGCENSFHYVSYMYLLAVKTIDIFVNFFEYIPA